MDIIRAMLARAGGHLYDGLEFMSPEIELHLSGAFPDLEGVYQGHAGVREFVALFNPPWKELTVQPYRFVDAGERVLVLSHFHGTGRDGIEVTLRMAHLWKLRDGLIVRMDAFVDEQEAFTAAGISDSPPDTAAPP